MNWFVHVVAFHPYIVLIAIGVLSSSCLIIPLVTKNLPDFQSPQLGFEARGNDIGQRLTALSNLDDETGYSGSLTLNPSELRLAEEYAKRPKPTYSPEEEEMDMEDSDEETPDGKNNKKLSTSNTSVIVEENHRNKTTEDEEWEELHSPDLIHHGPTYYGDDYFCGSPNGDYAHLVVATALNNDLLSSLHAIYEMCQFQDYLTSKAEYHQICEPNSQGQCCPIWSVPNYLAMLYNRTSCYNITLQDIYDFVDMLEKCAPHYYKLELSPNIESSNVPPECSKHNAAYTILHYLVDTDFLPAKQRSGELKSTMMFLPIARSSSSIPFYESIDTNDLKLSSIKLAAVDFGLKNLLFDKYLVRDLYLVAAGSIFILMCILVYTRSIFITVMTILAVIFSLAIAYCFYSLVLGLKFFPFMNVLAAIVAIGIGSDDAFILCKVWKTFKKEKPHDIISLTHNILRHCALALFVTTITTCAAFFSSFITNITSIKCFSIFAGVSVAANFILMLTWLPACIVIVERWFPSSHTYRSPMSSLTLLNVELINIGSSLARFLVMLVVKFKYLFVLIFGCLGAASIVVVFYYPKLRLPDTAEFQLFRAEHPFEQYDLVYREKFWFMRLSKGDAWDNPAVNKMPLQFVWGVLPIDTGDYLDPLSRGKVHFDPSFDMSDPESQAWLRRFCAQLRNQTFYAPTLDLLLSNCFIESFIEWMKQRCIDRVTKTSRAPCCESEHFPFSKRVFSICIKRAVESLHRTPREYFGSALAGPKFSKKGKNHIKAVVVEYQSNVTHSTSFVKMHQFYTEFEAWTKKIMSEAPRGMRNGWFISDLQFYNLQLTLAEDTVLSIAVSMLVAFVVLLGVTLNIILSFLAIITVTLIITVTVAILVLLGWQLNVLESVAMNVAIGLAVDFSLHYAVNYRLCPSNNCRISCVVYSLSMMAGPTVMAALTSGAAGAFMLPSDVLPYRQIGIFLIVVMTISWFYSTFFLMPLLCIMGPENDFGQFSYPNIKLWLSSLKSHDGSKCRSVSSSVFANMLSDSPFSVSSVAGSNQNSCCETHELDSLQYSNCNKGKKSQNKTKHRGTTLADQSPSAVSSTTIIHDDDSNSIVC